MKQEKLPLNHVANSIRKWVTVWWYKPFESSVRGRDRSEYKFSSYEEKKTLLELLKKWNNYKKDENLKAYKRNRWKDIQNYASNHQIPIEEIKEIFYSMELPIDEVDVLLDQYKATLPQNIDWDTFSNADTQVDVWKIIDSFQNIMLPKLKEIMNNEKIPLWIRKEYVISVLKEDSPFSFKLNGDCTINITSTFDSIITSLKLVEKEDYAHLSKWEKDDREQKYSLEKDEDWSFQW